MFALKIFGDSLPSLCALSTGLSTGLGQSLARVKISGASAPRSRNIFSWKTRLGWVQTHTPNFLDSGPKFTVLFSRNAGGIVLDQLAFRLWISLVFAEIRDQSQKLCKIGPNFACFLPQKFFKGGLPEILDLYYKNRRRYGSRCKVLRRSADGARRSSDEKNITTKTEGLPELPFRAA